MVIFNKNRQNKTFKMKISSKFNGIFIGLHVSPHVDYRYVMSGFTVVTNNLQWPTFNLLPLKQIQITLMILFFKLKRYIVYMNAL